MSEQREDIGPDRDPSAQEAEEQAWWEAEGMPWKKEPQRADYLCLTWFGVVAVFSLILLPTRAWLLGVAPDWLAMITGGRTAVAASGRTPALCREEAAKEAFPA